MKSLQQFIAEHLEKLVITTAQKNKEKTVAENSRGEKTVAENQEASSENENRETEK